MGKCQVTCIDEQERKSKREGEGEKCKRRRGNKKFKLSQRIFLKKASAVKAQQKKEIERR